MGHKPRIEDDNSGALTPKLTTSRNSSQKIHHLFDFLTARANLIWSISTNICNFQHHSTADDFHIADIYCSKSSPFHHPHITQVDSLYPTESTMASVSAKIAAIEAVETLIQYKFNHSALLWEALQCPSSPDSTHPNGNKRLAIIGDTVL